MNPQTSTEQVTDGANGVAPARVGDEGELTQELIERVTKLDPVARLRLSDILSVQPDESEGTPEEIRQSWREEILRRLASIKNGTAKFYTVEETLAYLDELCGPDGES